MLCCANDPLLCRQKVALANGLYDGDRAKVAIEPFLADGII